MDILNAVKAVVMSAKPQVGAQGPVCLAIECATAIPMCADSFWIVRTSHAVVRIWNAQRQRI